MYRIGILVGAIALWLVIYQGFFRYEYTVQNGYAVQRHDRLTGETCGIPKCLPPTPTPVPKPTVFDPDVSYGEYSIVFAREARDAVALVRKTAFGEELMHSKGAAKFAWTVEWSDQVAGSLFVLHDPKLQHPLPIDQKYIDSLRNPAYHVKLVCFCNVEGAGYRWEVNPATKQIVYVNDNPRLEKKYGLIDASASL